MRRAKSKGKGGQGSGERDGNCLRCGKPGHFARNCCVNIQEGKGKDQRKGMQRPFQQPFQQLQPTSAPPHFGATTSGSSFAGSSQPQTSWRFGGGKGPSQFAGTCHRCGRVGHTKADCRAVMMLEPAQQQVQLQQAAMQPQRAVQSIASWSSLVGIVGDNSVESVVLVIAEVVSQVDQRDATHLLVDSGAFTYALWERERSWPSTYSFPCSGKSPVCYFLGIWHCPEMCWLFVGAGSARLGFLGAAALSEHGHDTHGAAGQLLACMVREGKLTRQVPMTTRNA